MKKALTPIFFIIFTITLSGAIQAQDYAEGYVYEDLNLDGQRNNNEPGVAGVSVSNQHHVVLTDENGFYRLPVEDETILFVSKPAEYSFPLNELNLPQFYYIHHPEGSPDLEYAGIEPTGPLPESVDFGLIPSTKKEQFSAVVFGDPQTRTQEELDYYRDGIVSEMASIHKDMTFVLGDIMYDNLDLYDRYNHLMATLQSPVFNLVGNHDLNFDTDGNRYARETFKKHSGPGYYSFDEGDVHFIIIDNNNYKGLNDGAAQYDGQIDDTQLEWISNNLSQVDHEKLIVLLAHIPLFTPGLDDVDVLRTSNRRELIQLLEDFDNVLFMGGHMHTNFQNFLGEDFGRTNPNPIHHILTAAASGSWWGGPKTKNGVPVTTQRDGSPNGYHILEFNGTEYTERFKAAGLDRDYQMRIEMPSSEIVLGETDHPEIRVNVFNGSEKSEVKARFNHGEWFEMERVELAESTFFIELRETHSETFADWIQPVPTTHIWRSPFPDDIESGVHSVNVYTKDMFGH